jgi:hypothetical protein
MRILSTLSLLAMAIILPGCKTDTPSGKSAAASPSHFIGFADLSQWTQSVNEPILELSSPEISPPAAWNELVVSWNAGAPPGTFLEIKTAGIYPERTTKFYSLGRWSEDPSRFPRESVRDQKDEDGDVQTDTLVLKTPVQKARVKIFFGGEGKNLPRLKFVGLSFYNTTVDAKPKPPNYSAWGKAIEVPQRSQVSYQAGSNWCSPTSVSMVLAHWAGVLNRPELDVAVPEVAKAIYDPNWPGTGNWPFNTAFAGRFDGMRAYVSRLDDLAELEEWIKAGIPVAISAPLDLLKGQPHKPGSGHLIVCVGFTEQGDVVVNDPFARPDAGESVRKIYPRKNVTAAWQASHRTVYFIYPESATIPADRYGHWETR